MNLSDLAKRCSPDTLALNADVFAGRADKPRTARTAQADSPQNTRSEEDEQIALMQRIEAHTRQYPDFQRIHHSPNGGQRHKRTAARMKAAGTRAGFPDLVYPAQRGRYAGLAIEMKAGSNKPTAHQRGWLAWLGEQGWRVAVCYSADEAFDIIMEYERA